MSKTQKEINRKYHARMKALVKEKREKEIFDSLSAGKNSYMRLDRLASSSFDKSWIEVIEGVIFDLGEIISNPKMNTKVEGNIVPVELARKTGAESVQHLSSHTQYIKEIDEYGNVIPSKIMTMVNEDDIKTYDNRFIATFVRRLLLFVEKRYEFVSQFAVLRNEEILFFKNKSTVDGAEVEIETKVKISYPNEDEMGLKSNAYIERIAKIREYILYFYNSSFMKQLKTERDVRNPILQTNVIRKNPKYHHCYEVYKFIEGYDQLGVNYKVDENFSIFNEEELNELNRTLFANYITLKGKELSTNHKTYSKVYKPKILTSSDDEMFIYGPLLSGPISFVRVDEPYQAYLDSKLRKDLPLHPTKKEREYYADEYKAKAENKEDLKQKNDLLKRKAKEQAAFEKSVEKVLSARERARLELEAIERRIIEAEENARLAEARRHIIAASLLEKEALELAQDREELEREQRELEEARKALEEEARRLKEEKDAIIAEAKEAEQEELEAETAEQEEQGEEENASEQPKEEQEAEEEEIIYPALEEEELEEGKPHEDDVPLSPATYISHKEQQPSEEQPSEEQPEEVSNVENAEEGNPGVPNNEQPSGTEEAKQPVEEVASEAAPEQASEEQQAAEQAEAQSNEQPSEESSKEEQPQEGSNNENPDIVVVPVSDGQASESNEASEQPSEQANENNEQPGVSNNEQPLGSEAAEERSSNDNPDVVVVPVVEEVPSSEQGEANENNEQPGVPNNEPPSGNDDVSSNYEEGSLKTSDSSVVIPTFVEGNASEANNAPAGENNANTGASYHQAKVITHPNVSDDPINGKFIIFNRKGYYVNENEYTANQKEAKVFDEYHLAKKVAKVVGGKIVKIL